MGKLAYGVSNPHIQQSKGGDSDLMKFYCTTNATTYGRKFSKFQPRPGRHTGTGYQSNFRPGVYYTPQLDELDNPTMGRIVADNYHSITEKHYRPYEGPTGREPLPNSCKQVPSGFVRQKPLTIPTSDEVMGVCMNTRVASAPADIMPRHRPHLHKIQAKDPVEGENGGYGPAYMTTETHQKFKGQQPDRSDISRKSIGHKEGSGFVHGQNDEPITFNPDKAYRSDVPGWLTSRPTGVSIFTTDYRPSKFPQGDEPLPRLANRSIRDTGFTTGTKARPGFVHRVMGDAYDKAGDMPPAKLDRTRKQDPAEFLNMTNPNNYTSISKSTFRGQQRPDPSEADRLGKTKVGSKEPSGFCENNDGYIHTADNPARFITHYQTRFQDKTPYGLDRDGHTWGGVQPHQPDGFTRSTQVHEHGPEVSSTGTLRNLEPYVARSIKARDQFFDDHSYDTKMHTTSFQRSMTLPVA